MCKLKGEKMSKGNMHHIIEISIFDSKIKERCILERRYKSHLFNPSALRWFENEVLYRFPEAKKIPDKTLAGFHFNSENYSFELR